MSDNPARTHRSTFEERVAGLTIGAVRILVGTLWIANANWKRPSDFGAANNSGLARWVKVGIANPVFPPFTWLLKHVVQPHLTPFGWMTLLTEATVAALLVLGWKIRIAGLVGAAMSLVIALTIVRTPFEWPWAYYLMIGIHLLLAAVSAGDHYGLDAIRGSGDRARTARTALTALGGFALVAGVAGVVVSIDDPFTAKFGSLVGSRAFEVKLFWFNLLAALICVAIGVLALLGAKTRRREFAISACALSTLAAVQVLVQWRGNPPKESGGILGGNGGTLALWFILAVGIAVTIRAQSAQRPARSLRTK